jgi:hypothetical protein
VVIKLPFFGAFMSGDRTNALMTVPVPIAVHLRCHKSTIVFESPSWLRFSRINDGVSKSFPLFAGHFVTQGASIVLLGMSPIVEMSGS